MYDDWIALVALVLIKATGFCVLVLACVYVMTKAVRASCKWALATLKNSHVLLLMVAMRLYPERYQAKVLYDAVRDKCNGDGNHAVRIAKEAFKAAGYDPDLVPDEWSRRFMEVIEPAAEPLGEEG